jgi:carboxyl-terminal processing protease
VSTQTLRGKKIGTLSLTTFASYSACVDVKNGLTELTRQGAEALIFDLRGNGGGFVDQAVCIASLFLGSGKSVFEQRNLLSEDRRTFSTTGQAQTSLPMITLIDGGSASASEILAGAFQDHARSLIAGRRSFGKATMQLGMEHRLPGITLWMTVARFYLPSGRTNQLVGITPDFELEPKPDATLDDLFELREEDLYTNALPALSEPWQQTRPQVIRMIRNSCAGHERRIRRAYQAASQGPFAPDYPLIAAADLLRCTTETALVR